MSSNATLRRILQEQTGRQAKGKDASKRPDLLLLCTLDSRYTLIEFKRPSHVISRDDQLQAEKYRDRLGQFRPMDIVLVGRDHDPAVRADRASYVKLLSYGGLISKAKAELDWLLKELTDVRGLTSGEIFSAAQG
jgi:hypothetical protein